MADAICLNEKYSTTRVLQKEKPLLKKEPHNKFESVLFLPINDKRKVEGGLRTKGYFKKSYGGKPLVTIVTVTYNSEQFLEETIKSILQQTYDNLEYIVIDGGSTDRTLDILEKYGDAIDYFVSEPDNGMYDALNKGFTLATGELINFCNSDDMFYANDIIETIVNKYNQEKFDFCYGMAEFIDAEGKHISYHYPVNFKQRYVVTLGMPFVQPTSFWKRSIMQKSGLFDLKYKIASDYDLISRLLLQSSQIYNTKIPVIKFRKHGVSFGDKNTNIALQETSGIKSSLIIQLKMNKKFIPILEWYDRLFQKVYRMANNRQ